jgi:plasmid stabilization system protein ParE
VRSIRYHEEAREEFLHQVRYYTEISARLGERFDKAIQAAEARAAEFPDMGSPYNHGTRRVFPKKFKFSIVYVHSENEILILAVAPFRKKPGYWKARK